MADHTPEPWGAEEGPITLHGKQWSLLSPVDYERARACVNACAGMPLADVQELASIPGGVMALTVKADDYRLERDAAREALGAAEEFIAGFEDDDTQEGIADLLTKIRNARGGTS